MNFNEFLSMTPKYWISSRCPDRFWSDAELLFNLSCHGGEGSWEAMQNILRIREKGITYSNEQFDVLGSALRILHR